MILCECATVDRVGSIKQIAYNYVYIIMYTENVILKWKPFKPKIVAQGAGKDETKSIFIMNSSTSKQIS